MHHRVFALLDDIKELDPVLAEIDGDERCHGQCSVIVHKDGLPEDEVGFAEVDERRWLGRGVLFGAVAGGLVGLAMGPLGYIGASDLVPEVNKPHSLASSFVNLAVFTAALALMFALVS